VPTLHVLFIREHRLDIFVALPDPFRPQIREELLSWIAEEALGGDRDAAEWVLLTCVARVYVFPSLPGRPPFTLSPVLANLALAHSNHLPLLSLTSHRRHRCHPLFLFSSTCSLWFSPCK
jgi:hypothetical protein